MNILLAALVLLGVVDTYDLRLSLYIPQVKNNSTSEGTRAYQRQTLKGTVKIDYSGNTPEITIPALTNYTYYVNNVPVTYATTVTYANWVYLGNNATEVFKVPCMSLDLEAEPSYAKIEANSDNSLYLTVSGRGATVKRIRGYATGRIGCGCTDYGHISPTRLVGPYGALDYVIDVAPVYGNWWMTWRNRDE